LAPIIIFLKGNGKTLSAKTVEILCPAHKKENVIKVYDFWAA